MLPAAAQGLLFRPFEIAHLDGRTLAEAGLRFVYTIASAAPPPAEDAARQQLRVLAIFSLPDDTMPLNLREERYQLKCQLEGLAQTRGLALTIRTLQYGATRQTLQEALEDGEGWDIVHFSGHGLEGELVLEKDDGTLDCLPAADFLAMLQAASPPPQLVTLSACYSGAASLNALHAERARLDRAANGSPASADASGKPGQAAREGYPPPPDDQPQAATQFPSLAQQVAEGLDCAVLAMRYAVGDEFSIALLLGLFDHLLDKKRALPDALQLALAEALKNVSIAPETSAITPLLFGRRAARLKLVPPALQPDYTLPAAGLGLAFPEEPPRFVDRLRPMLHASQALAPESGLAGVLFYGMAGAGKTACALELAYRHERDRFTGYVWFKAPDEDQSYEPGRVFTDFLLEMERQLSLHDLGLTAYADHPEEFARRTAPRLKDVLQRSAILVAIDNAESLLTQSGAWRDPKWGVLIEEVLLAQRGASRLVLTSRRLPAALQNHPRLCIQSLHALSWRESALLGRSLPHLRALSADPATRDLWFRALDAAQGHPKLLELADKLAAAPAALRHRLADSSPLQGGGRVGGRDDAKVSHFFARGESDYTETDFLAVLARWTTSLAAALPPTARLLLYFLARLEQEDLDSQIVEANWENFLKRVEGKGDRGAGDKEKWDENPARTGAEWGDCPRWAAAARQEPALGLPAAIEALAACGLLEIRPLPRNLPPANLPPANLPPATFNLHPAIAETARALAPAAALSAADWELGDYWKAVFMHGIKTELQGGGRLVVTGGKHAAVYLLRTARWEEVGALLERVIQRDSTPATIAFALPALRQIAEATKDSELEFGIAVGLTNALFAAKRFDEAERMERDVIARCVARGNYRQASANTGNLINLLMVLGHSEEALPLAEDVADYTCRAGLGPWSQLMAEGLRLQLLNALGRYAEVLEAVERLRPEIGSLPEVSAAEEIATPWNVRESLLNIGLAAAMGLEQWQTMLTLNAEIFHYQEARGASAIELAHMRFNDHGPLIRMHLYSEARRLLEICRAVFEQNRDLPGLGKVFSALADLEEKDNHYDQSIHFEQIALRYKYQVGEPGDCSISHNNLAEYLHRLKQPATISLAHRLAAAVISLQTGSGILLRRINGIATSPLPRQPPSFAEVVATVEQIEGVRFAALFSRLPARAPDGEAAIAAVWEMVGREQGKREEGKRAREAALAQMPPAILEAIQSGDEARFRAALEKLPPEEQQAVFSQLEALMRQAGAPMETQAGPDMEKILQEFEPLLRGIAAVANGDDARRTEIEAALPEYEKHGWHLMGPVISLWHGERDLAVLTEGLDASDARLVQRILDYIGAAQDDNPTAA